jgi:hypothetical protein
LPQEHCTLAPNVKTSDSNVSIFLSRGAGLRASVALRPEKSSSLPRTNMLHRGGASKRESGGAVAHLCAATSIEISIEMSGQSKLRYNIHAA